jgi:hypothetical protein
MPMPQGLSEWMTLVKDAITSFSALIAAAIAIIGLRTWKRQLLGKTEYELARRLLRIVYRARDAVQVVRNPFVSAGESVSAMEEAGVDIENYNPMNPQHTAESQRAVYQRRWDKLQQVFIELEAEALEAEVVWGSEIPKLVDPLHRHASTLFVNIKMYLRNLERRTDPYQEMNEKELKRRREIDRIIYAGGENDKFAAELTQVVEDIEMFLKQYLKL